jgi:hypothetical protein
MRPDVTMADIRPALGANTVSARRVSPAGDKTLVMYRRVASPPEVEAIRVCTSESQACVAAHHAAGGRAWGREARFPTHRLMAEGHFCSKVRQ